MEPLLISYDNAPTEETEFFIKTLKANRWNYNIVGIGDKWEGFTTRTKSYYAHLKLLPEDQIVILSDARDVVCVRSPKAFVDAYASFKKPIVVSMELVCGGKMNVPDDFKFFQCKPLTEYWRNLGMTDKPARKFVNAGLVCGRAGDLVKFYEWAIKNEFTDDQLALGHYMCSFPDQVGADIHAELLHTTNFGVNAGVLDIHIQKHDAPTLAEIFGRGAFFIHTPGSSTKRGNYSVYIALKALIDAGFSDEMLRGPYKYAEPVWNEIF